MDGRIIFVQETFLLLYSKKKKSLFHKEPSAVPQSDVFCSNNIKLSADIAYYFHEKAALLTALHSTGPRGFFFWLEVKEMSECQ